MNNAVTITGSHPAIMRATGTLNLSNCAFNAMGLNTVAGFPNTPADFTGRITIANGVLQINGTVILGANRSLPGGNSAVYNYTGTMK